MEIRLAARQLGLHPASAMRLRKQGVLESDGLGGVTDVSVLAYARRKRGNQGYMDKWEAAAYLGIPERGVRALVRQGLIGTEPGLARSRHLRRRDVAALREHPEWIARAGIKVPPPSGWLTTAEAMAIVDCGKSWLAHLGRRGTIRRLANGRHTTWYNEADVREYARQGLHLAS